MTKATTAKLGLSVVAVAGIGFVMYSSVVNGQRFENVDDLTAGDLAQWDGRDMRVGGWVVPNSIVEKVIDQQTHRTFVMHGFAGRKMRVFNVGPKPDTFMNESQVVSSGRIVPANTLVAEAGRLGVTVGRDEYVIDASDLSAKCPSKYDNVKPSQVPIKY